MAITKILHINEVDTGNPARHLEQALDYIQNPEKTNENVLVGSINCLPETAFEQMMDTKATFGKTDKRQGYHIIISFVPGETTEEIAFDIVERFAKEYLKDEYEAVYAVHNDKNHMHEHLIFNSVNLVTGAKYEYRKGGNGNAECNPLQTSFVRNTIWRLCRRSMLGNPRICPAWNGSRSSSLRK